MCSPSARTGSSGNGVPLMRTATRGRALAGAARSTAARLSTGRLATALAAVAVLLLAGDRGRHTVLLVVGALALFAAGAGFLLRWRVTGTRTSRHTGAGLVLLGLAYPA